MKKIRLWESLKVFIPLAIFVCILCTFVILPPFKTLEQSELTKSLNSCQETLNSEIKTLSILAKDWAEWDDTYKFVQDGNEEYIEANLPWGYLNGSLGLDALYVIGLNGHIVWGETSGIDPDTATSLPQEILISLLPQGPIFDNILAKKSVSGLFPASDGYWLIAASKIVQSSGEGPIKGIFVMGRFLSPNYLSKLSVQSQHNFTLQKPPKNIKSIDDIENGDAVSRWYPLNSDKSQAFRQINDLANSNLTWISLTSARYIYHQGLRAASLSGAILLLMVVGITILWAKLTYRARELQSIGLKLTEQQKVLVKAQQLGQLGSWRYDPEQEVFIGTELMKTFPAAN